MKSARKHTLPRVLVVDDQPQNGELMARALRHIADVELCTDGESALQRVAEEPFLAVLTDQRMPGMSGVELLERVAHVAPGTVRMLITAHATTDVLTSAINLGRVEFCFTKPVAVSEVVQAVAGVAARSPSSKMVPRAVVAVGADVLETVRSSLVALRAEIEEVQADELVASLADAPSVVVFDSGALSDPGAAAVEIRRQAPGAVVVCIVDRRGGGPSGTDLLNVGVDEVVWRPLRPDEFAVRLRRALDRLHMVESARFVRGAASLGGRQLMGQSAAMRRVLQTIEQVASTDATVLVRGETGTGKELVARIVHALSSRHEMPFVAVNCGALPENLVESEMFGHERGAFTGAVARRRGRFEAAQGGTLFIDEIGDLPMAVQVKLLRVLEERSFERVGGNATIEADIRIIAATHRDLETMVDQGTFRQDLFYRINVVPILIPPLRERTDDIWLLAAHYLQEFQARMNKQGIRISAEMRRSLEEHPWPGNVRELVNVIERAVALTPSHGVATSADFPRVGGAGPPARDLRGSRPAQSLREALAAFEKTLILQALERSEGNRSRAARDLGLTRQGLFQKIAKYSL